MMSRKCLLPTLQRLAMGATVAVAGACSNTAELPVSVGIGPDPTLPPAEESLLPTVNVAPATGWPERVKPKPAQGTRVVAFADQLDHPRWLYVLPNGDVLVAETNAPERPLRGELLGLRGWMMGKLMQRGGAAIWEFDRASGQGRIYASGLRNPVGMAWQGATLWVAVNERDELGPNLVPDYITSVREGGFYGWPYSYYGKHVDDRVQPPDPDLVAQAIKPDYALGSHTASLGLTSAQGSSSLPDPFKQGMFVGQHGSWNRDPPSGYKVIFVPFTGGKPSGIPVDVLTGFLDEDGQARGRPVGVAIDKRGALLVADDVGNVIWRVSSVGATALPH